MLKGRDWLWGRGILLFCFWDRVSLCRSWSWSSPCRPGCLPFLSAGITAWAAPGLRLESVSLHLGGDSGVSGEPLRGSGVNRLGWRHTENLVFIHFNWSLNSWGHCNLKEVKAGRLGVQGYPQLHGRFQASLDYMRPWDLFLKKKAWIFFFNFCFLNGLHKGTNVRENSSGEDRFEHGCLELPTPNFFKPEVTTFSS